jgi:hypothetical protein
MRPIAMIRFVLGSALAIALSSAGCSSSDGPVTTPGAGSAGKDGGSAGKGGTSGKGGSAGKGGTSGKGGSAGKGGTSGRGGKGGGDTAGDPSNAGDGSAATAGEGAAAGEGGSGGDAPIDPCASCASGHCLASGQCVDCLATDDQCPAGKYCGPGNTCVPGCKNEASCASGVCGATHDCQSCLSDQECSSDHVCGAQLCAAACSAQQEGGNAGCGTGLTCCSLHCVATNSDNAHCGACGTACNSAQFCGQSGCVSSKLSSICQIAKVVVVLDGQTGDDPVGRAVAQMLVAQCPAPPAVREVAQTAADALNPSNGRPVAGGDELIVLAGGSAVQSAAGYLTAQKVAPLTNASAAGKYQLIDTSNDLLITSELTSDANDSHDLFAVQFMREASSGSLILNTYGFTPFGTAAASVYLDKALLPNLSTSTKSWYVGEWSDADGDKTPELNELTLIASGG